MNDKWIWPILLANAVSMAAIFSLIIDEEEKNKRSWEAFKREHHCRVVGKFGGDTVPVVGLSSSGSLTVGVASTTAKTGWQCDDGVTYWK